MWWPVLKSDMDAKPKEQEAHAADARDERETPQEMELDADIDGIRDITDLTGDTEKPGFDSYVTFYDLTKKQYKQTSAQIPVSSSRSPAGVVINEFMSQCKKCGWVSLSKTEQERHNVCNHAMGLQPMASIRASMVKAAEEAAKKTPVPRPNTEGLLADAAPNLKIPKPVLKRPAAKKEQATISKKPAAKVEEIISPDEDRHDVVRELYCVNACEFDKPEAIPTQTQGK